MIKIDQGKVLNVHGDGSAHVVEGVRQVKVVYDADEDKTHTTLYMVKDNPDAVLEGVQTGESNLVTFTPEAEELYLALSEIKASVSNLLEEQWKQDPETDTAEFITKIGTLEELNRKLTRGLHLFTTVNQTNPNTIAEDDDYDDLEDVDSEDTGTV